MMKKVWVAERRDDEFCEDAVVLFTSRRKAHKQVRDWAEDLTGKKWRSLREGAEFDFGYVNIKEPGYFESEHDSCIIRCWAYQAEVK